MQKNANPKIQSQLKGTLSNGGILKGLLSKSLKDLSMAGYI
jgi:hypothetical protein